jgi:hypothetical protein
MNINRICKIESVQKNFIKEKSVILEKFRKKSIEIGLCMTKKY